MAVRLAGTLSSLEDQGRDESRSRNRADHSSKAGAFSITSSSDHGRTVGLKKNIVFLQKTAIFFDKPVVHR
jgi:hypothetical protein